MTQINEIWAFRMLLPGPADILIAVKVNVLYTLFKLASGLSLDQAEEPDTHTCQWRALATI
jgi:hypothetical protein